MHPILRVAHFWKSIGWFVFIFIISAVPGQQVPELPFWNFDKLVHGAVYFWLAIFLHYDLEKHAGDSFWRRNAYPVAFACSIGYGGLLEVLQAFVFINRSGSWLDFWMNTLGVVAAGVLVKVIKRRIGNAQSRLRVC